jgi:hypothetical protein
VIKEISIIKDLLDYCELILKRFNNAPPPLSISFLCLGKDLTLFPRGEDFIIVQILCVGKIPHLSFYEGSGEVIL